MLNRSIGGILYQWHFGDGSDPLVQFDSVYHTFENPGTYEVLLYAVDENTCQKIDVARKVLNVFEPHFIFPPDTTICEGESVTLVAGGAEVYEWNPATGLSDIFSSSPEASPDTTIVYYLSMEDANTCEVEDSVLVTVIPEIQIGFNAEIIYDCLSIPKIGLHNHTRFADQYLWELGDGTQSDLDSLIHTYAKPGDYTIKLTAYSNARCSATLDTKVHVADMFVPNAITPNKDGKNETFTIITDAALQLKILNRWGKTVYQSENYRNDWNGNYLPAGVYFYEITLDQTVSCNGWIQLFK